MIPLPYRHKRGQRNQGHNLDDHEAYHCRLPLDLLVTDSGSYFFGVEG